MVGGYAPGVNPVVFPNSQELKMGIKLPANADLILQIHTPYYTSIGPSYGMDVNIQIRLYFFPEEESNIREVFSEVPLQYWGNDFLFFQMKLKQFQQNQILLLVIYLFFQHYPIHIKYVLKF